MFWLSYECFSLLCNAFLLKSAISSHSSCVFLSQIFFNDVNHVYAEQLATYIKEKLFVAASIFYGCGYLSLL